MPYFSIIVPVYNVAPYLRKALDSVVAQTFTDWECLCVDDGSTDGSGAILDEYAARDKRFRVFHKENGGVSSARNVGLDHAKGDWLCFLDADDALHPKLLGRLAPLTHVDDEYDLIEYNYKRGVQSAFTEQDCNSTETYVIDLAEGLPQQGHDRGFGGKIYRFSIGESLRFQPYTVGEDLLYAAEWLCISRKILVTTMNAYWYRVRIGSATQTPNTLKKMTDSLGSSFGILKAYERCRERIDSSRRRYECMNVSERTADWLVCFPPSREKDLFLRDWFSSLLSLSTLRLLSPWYRVTFLLVGKYHIFWKILFLVPFRCKMFRNRLRKIQSTVLSFMKGNYNVR